MSNIDPIISIYNTSIGSLNNGDQIINEAGIGILEDIFPNSFFHHFPTHHALQRRSLKVAWKNRICFVIGTNLLRNKIRYRGRKNKIAIHFHDCLFMQPIILFGVGWNKYAGNLDMKTKFFYKNALSKNYLHSVRDNYAKDKLKACGIKNTINTGCPSLWELSDTHLKGISIKKQKKALLTLTDYSKDIATDSFILKTLLQNYESVYLWPQGSGDRNYFSNLIGFDSKQVTILSSHLSSLNKVLEMDDIEHIGTRLHAGIRALQKKRPSLIISIDNRASEMHRDFNLPTIERSELHLLQEKIDTERNFSMCIPFEAIAKWKKQFDEF